MKLVCFTRPGSDELCFGALLAGGDVLDFTAAGADLPRTTQALDWCDLAGSVLPPAMQLARQVEADTSQRERLRTAAAVLAASDVNLRAPVPRPAKVMCIGLNYRDHAEESGMDIPERPLMFSKFSTSITGPEANVELPPGSREVDYEAELAVIIGRRAKRVAAADAYDHVLGYANLNDVSARDFQFADGQWQRGKSCDDFAPLGPYVATTDEIPDPHVLSIQFRLNGETLQNSSTNQLIFGVPALIEAITSSITLEPGDVIATGTPPGVGFARKPPVYVQADDVMEVEIEGLGVLRNTARAAE